MTIDPTVAGRIHERTPEGEEVKITSAADERTATRMSIIHRGWDARREASDSEKTEAGPATDLRPALTWLRAAARAQRRRGVGTRYTLPDGRSWTALADGHAINLFHAEGVSELDYDPFTALLLSLVLETARVRGRGVDVERLCAEIAGRQPAPSTLPSVSVVR